MQLSILLNLCASSLLAYSQESSRTLQLAAFIATAACKDVARKEEKHSNEERRLEFESENILNCRRKPESDVCFAAMQLCAMWEEFEEPERPVARASASWSLLVGIMPVKDSMAWQTWTMRTGGRRQAEQMLVEVKDNLVIAFRLVGRVSAGPRIPVKRSPGRPMRRFGSARAALRRPRRLAQPGLSCFAPPNRGAQFMGQAWFRRAAAFEQMRDPRNALLDLEEVPAVPSQHFSATELFPGQALLREPGDRAISRKRNEMHELASGLHEATCRTLLLVQAGSTCFGCMCDFSERVRSLPGKVAENMFYARHKDELSKMPQKQTRLHAVNASSLLAVDWDAWDRQ